jgi:crotonobetainyl-CoA:carnitine CoA-transferase CaiB-like acyl-CoA transferase
MGADVIKVEPPMTGDLSRSMGGASLRMTGRDNAPFFALNRNKRSVTLDLKVAADRARFLALEAGRRAGGELPPGVISARARLSDAGDREPATGLRQHTGFGQRGPADRPGFDLIAQGIGNHERHGEPGGGR